MNPDEFRALLARLGLLQRQASIVLGVHHVTLRRYATGALPIPLVVAHYLACLDAMPPKPRAAFLADMLREEWAQTERDSLLQMDKPPHHATITGRLASTEAQEGRRSIGQGNVPSNTT